MIFRSFLLMQVLQRLGKYTQITSTSTASDKYEITTR